MHLMWSSSSVNCIGPFIDLLEELSSVNSICLSIYCSLYSWTHLFNLVNFLYWFDSLFTVPSLSSLKLNFLSLYQTNLPARSSCSHWLELLQEGSGKSRDGWWVWEEGELYSAFFKRVVCIMQSLHEMWVQIPHLSLHSDFPFNCWWHIFLTSQDNVKTHSRIKINGKVNGA